jgi:RNA polymerase sigma-70 factor (ECF subfamily)
MRADFASFYAAQLPRVVAHVYAMGGDFAEAEEAAQEAFVRAWSRWKTLSGYADPAAWTVLVAQRIAVSRWRRRQVARRYLLRHPPTPESEGPGPESVALIAALRRLPVEYQRVLVLHHLADLSVADIAVNERSSEGAIKARLARARTALAVLLEEPPGAVPRKTDPAAADRRKP